MAVPAEEQRTALAAAGVIAEKEKSDSPTTNCSSGVVMIGFNCDILNSFPNKNSDKIVNPQNFVPKINNTVRNIE